MTTASRSRTRFAIVAAPLLGSVWAASSAAATPTTAAGAVATTSVPASPATPAMIKAGVESLPDWAYPEPVTRGLPYGSLWLTFHGLQWPYLRPAAGDPRFVLAVSGWGWVDNAIEKFGPWGEHPDREGAKLEYWKQQARLLLRITPTYSLGDDWFVQAQAELVATGDQTIGRSDVGGADTDDLYLRMGKWDRWDFMVGRYEGWEVFHLGMGLDQNTFERQGAVGREASEYGIAFYGLTDNQFRPQGAAGNLALHYYPSSKLRFELLGMSGSLSGPTVGTRPVGILDLGWLKLKAGTEYRRETGQLPSVMTRITRKGVAGSIQLVFLPQVEFGLNAAQGSVWHVDSSGRPDYKKSMTRTSFGGFATVSNGSVRHPMLLGVGAVYTHTEDQNDVVNPGVVDKYWLLQSYAAVQYVATPQLHIKLVAGYSRGHWFSADSDPPIAFDDDMVSLRLRFAFYY